MNGVLSLAPSVDRALLNYMPVREGLSRPLVEAMLYSLAAGGKRLRPCLCLFAAGLFGGDRHIAMPFACAVEMIHTYSLIHDDLPAMDDDDMRRGKPSCHVAHGEAAAILAGDALLTHAFEVMAEAALTCADKFPAIRAMHLIAACSGTRGMLGGQMADVYPPVDNDPRTLLTYIEQNKTAKLIKAALVSGLILGGAPDNARMAFTMFASRFGAAFQITDDILDAESGESQTKLTAPGLYGIDRARGMAKRQVAEAVESIAAYPQARPLAELAEWLLVRDN